jgi:hypothetical protein
MALEEFGERQLCADCVEEVGELAVSERKRSASTRSFQQNPPTAAI